MYPLANATVKDRRAAFERARIEASATYGGVPAGPRCVDASGPFDYASRRFAFRKRNITDGGSRWNPSQNSSPNCGEAPKRS